MTLTTISYGGGVQSTAMLVLAATGRLGLDVEAALFANVGDDAEHPATLRFVREIATPWAAERGLPIVELRRVRRDGSIETLLGRALETERSFPLPMFGENGAPMTRACTRDFKIAVIATELRRRGASRADPADVAIGISVDEIERAGPPFDKRRPEQRRVYPLLALGMHRSDCAAVIADAGLPVPPKSSCYFCPFHDREAWRRLRRETPDLFEQAIDIEARYNAKLAALGKRRQYLTRHGRPLAEVIDEQQPLPGMEEPGCDSGWCMT